MGYGIFLNSSTHNQTLNADILNSIITNNGANYRELGIVGFDRSYPSVMTIRYLWDQILKNSMS